MANRAIAINQETGEYQGEFVAPAEIVLNGDPVSESWVTNEFPVEGKAQTGIWSGKPGKVRIDEYPYDEAFTVITGKIVMTNDDGTVVELGPGKSVFMPKGWSGTFDVVEETQKCFFTVEK